MLLQLYKFDACPFCQKVMGVIRQLGVQVEMHDIRKNPDDWATLVKVGGKSQVPCLFIDGKPLYESSDIVEWLKANAR